MLENLLKDVKEKISHFIDSDQVTVTVVGTSLEVRSHCFPMFMYNFREARTSLGMSHKMGFTPGRLMDLTTQLRMLAS